MRNKVIFFRYRDCHSLQKNKLRNDNIVTSIKNPSSFINLKDFLFLFLMRDCHIKQKSLIRNDSMLANKSSPD